MRSILRDHFGLALVALALLVSIFRVGLPPPVNFEAMAAGLEICTTAAKPDTLQIGFPNSGRVHKHSDPCEFCGFDFDDASAVPSVVQTHAFASVGIASLIRWADLVVRNAPWVSPRSRAPPEYSD
jgi:Protein of unknown function (DUF2946)